MDNLDGVSLKARKRLQEHKSIEDWLDLDSIKVTSSNVKGKKRVFKKKFNYPSEYKINIIFQVRWADVEEKRNQAKMRDVGFVVGQDWNRVMDPTQGESALTKTKIIPNRFHEYSDH